MKYSLGFLLFIYFSTYSQIGIGTDNPDQSAVLELESVNKGFLLPRLSSSERGDISSPTEGLVIYNTTSKSLEYSNGTEWITIKNLNDILITNTLPSTNYGGVIIGDTMAEPNAEMQLVSNDKGFLPPRLTTMQRNNILNPAVGLIIYNTDSDCIQIYDGDNWFDSCNRPVLGSVINCEPGFVAPFVPADETIVVEVTNPVTGKTWMDRNLGAIAPARSSFDCYAYGNLYQWGRGSDGHEYRNSDRTTTLATTEVPNDGNPWDGLFINMSTTPTGSPFDWLNPENGNLWDGVNGINNPCPEGFRVPTDNELEQEMLSWIQPPINSTMNASGAMASPLKLPAAGYRNFSESDPIDLVDVGVEGYYVSSSDLIAFVFDIQINAVRRLRFNSLTATMGNPPNFFNPRAWGYSVRCIKD